MSGSSFVDTSVLVYAVDFDPGERPKHLIAVDLLNRQKDDLILSTQVLQEYYNAVTRKLKRPMTEQRAADSVRSLAKLDAVTVDVPLVLSAIGTSRDAKLSLWDALIVEAARQAGCVRVLTEDLSDGQVIRGVRVVNPFARHDPTSAPT